tara:strand:- start:599 stop:1075 length:477 start_codon:yes stop_codon:yes gene_type:complete
MIFTRFKKNYLLIYIFLVSITSILSCAQENGNNEGDQSILLKEEIESQNNFFDALRLRTDLSFDTNKRILYTTIDNIETFTEKYKGTEMTLDYVIRDRLHTAIFLSQKKNVLESMDGSLFYLSQNISSEELTNELVSLIGKMYYGSSEVEQLQLTMTK